MANQFGSDRYTDDIRHLSRQEIVTATVADTLVMIANVRTTLLAGFIGGALAPLAFIIPIGLAVSLFPILNSFMVALMAGALLFAIVLTPLVIVSGFWERLRTVPVIEVAAALIILVVLIIVVLTIRSTQATFGFGTILGIFLTMALILFNLSHIVIGSGILGALMALLRRYQAHREIYWRLTIGPIVTGYFGPHQVLSFIAVPLGIMVALGAAIHNGHAFALQAFPIWILSGFLFWAYWEIAHKHILGKITGRSAWFRKSIALAKVLEDDSYLFGLRFESVGVDPERGVAQIRAAFRDPDQVYRARQVCLRVSGITDAEVVDTSDPFSKYT
jgi:hypothetical protein